MLVAKNAYLLEVNLATIAAGQTFTFPDDSKLRGKNILGIEVVNANQLAVSPNGKTMISATGALAVLVTIAAKTSSGLIESVYRMPYYSLTAANNGGIVRQFDNLPIVLSKSYLTITTTTGLTAGQSAALLFYF